MNNISFGSTYRIPLTGQGLTRAPRSELKEMVKQYQNHLLPNNNNGHVRVSIKKKFDKVFEQSLELLGYKKYQKFEKHNVPKSIYKDNVTRLDHYIQEELNKIFCNKKVNTNKSNAKQSLKKIDYRQICK